MSHLMSSVNPEAAEALQSEFETVGVGSVVTYHIQVGRQRQNRLTFPAFVLSQAPDDGALDLLVFFEPEDVIWERRVLPRTEIRDGHCWSPVEFTPISKEEMSIRDEIDALRAQIFSDFEAPDKSVMEYLDDFDKRLRALETSTNDRLVFLEEKMPGPMSRRNKTG